ncbi:MAG: carboxypeptidase-like regulatory domain-containing protein [Planctomycetes bacterium]|nr:carboxypeptidase-like regulatory domain-containing protein [Planctomycetota bacterium]
MREAVEQRRAFTVTALGFAPTVAWLSPDHWSSSTAHELQLVRSVVVEGRVLDSGGRAVAGALVRLACDGRELASAEERDRAPGSHVEFVGDPLTHRMVAIHDGIGLREWRAISDVDGRVTFTELARGRTLVVDIQLGAAIHEITRSIEVHDDESARVEWRLAETTDFHGRLVDQNGNAIDGVTVWLTPARSAATHHSFQIGEGVGRRALADERGAFGFQNVPEGDYFVGPVSLDAETAKELPAVGVRVRISADVEDRELEIRVDRGLFVDGFAIDSAGTPCADAHVVATREDGACIAQGKSELDGEFRLGPLMSGSYFVQASRTSCPCSASLESVSAGGAPILITLEAGSRVSGRATDDEVPAIELEELVVSSVAGPVRTLRAPQRNGGAFAFDVPSSGSYSIAARTRDGRIGVLHEVEVGAGATTAGLEIRLHRGSKLSIQNLHAGTETVLVRDERGACLAALSLLSGESGHVAVPPGHLRIERVRPGGVPTSIEVDMQDSEERQVSLADDD